VRISQSSKVSDELRAQPFGKQNQRYWIRLRWIVGGEHLPCGRLASSRNKRVRAIGVFLCWQKRQCPSLPGFAMRTALLKNHSSGPSIFKTFGRTVVLVWVDLKDLIHRID
jgi:hypothetical protein